MAREEKRREEKRDFSHPQADAFAGSESGRKSRPASFEMTVWAARPKGKKIGLLRSVPEHHSGRKLRE
jgi:hypothetical protein